MATLLHCSESGMKIKCISLSSVIARNLYFLKLLLKKKKKKDFELRLFCKQAT